MSLTNNYGRNYVKKLLKAPNMAVMRIRINESKKRGWYVVGEIGRFYNGTYGCVMKRD